jgi:fructose-1,6-bisphosphatase I
MVAAGYCMYGSMSYMMITTGKGVAGFTLDPTLGALAFCSTPACLGS